MLTWAVTGRYSEPDEHIPHPRTLFLLVLHRNLRFQNDLCLVGFSTKISFT